MNSKRPHMEFQKAGEPEYRLDEDQARVPADQIDIDQFLCEQFPEIPGAQVCLGFIY